MDNTIIKPLICCYLLLKLYFYCRCEQWALTAARILRKESKRQCTYACVQFTQQWSEIKHVCRMVSGDYFSTDRKVHNNVVFSTKEYCNSFLNILLRQCMKPYVSRITLRIETFVFAKMIETNANEFKISSSWIGANVFPTISTSDCSEANYLNWIQHRN